MAQKNLVEKLHFKEYFGKQRNHWWNDDFIELSAKRWDLKNRLNILDVGCGVGHWSRVFAPFINPKATVIGIDREQEWVAQASQISQELNLSNYKYQQGDATKLDFKDNSFDMVTCQTLLIHLRNPIDVLNEMYRVLKPGGIIVAVEPNNIARNLVIGNIKNQVDIDIVLKITIVPYNNC